MSRTAVDGLPASDTKGMNKLALNLFRCGHIQDIRVCYTSKKQLGIKSNCIPEMRKDQVYKLILILDSESYNVVGAECGCPAGKGPHASCKHVGAPCYAYSHIGRGPDFLTCTDKLQECNKPRQKRLDALPVTSLTSRTNEILLKRKGSSLVTFDPQPQEHRKLGKEVIEEFRCDLCQKKRSILFSGNVYTPNLWFLFLNPLLADATTNLLPPVSTYLR